MVLLQRFLRDPEVQNLRERSYGRRAQLLHEVNFWKQWGTILILKDWRPRSQFRRGVTFLREWGTIRILKRMEAETLALERNARLEEPGSYSDLEELQGLCGQAFANLSSQGIPMSAESNHDPPTFRTHSLLHTISSKHMSRQFNHSIELRIELNQS